MGRGLLRGFFTARSQEDAEDASESVKIIPPNKKDWLSLAGYAVVTYLILGSFFMLTSGGLSAGLASIPAYFGGWFSPSGVPASRLLISLLFYELLPLLLAIASLVRGILKRDELRIGLGLWLAAVVVLILANPSRQVTDLGWVLIPLLTLAAVEVSGYLVPIQDGTWETIGMAAFTTALLIFAALNYSSIALVPTDQVAGQLRWGILFGSLGLLGVSIIMVAFGWSILTAVQGSLWGGLAVMLVYSLSMSVASGGLRSTHSLELWAPGAYIDQEKTLVSQMNDISRWNKGVNSDLDVAIAGVDSPALLWALRNWPVTILPEANLAGSTPAVVISTQDLSSSNIQSVYRGQDFTWRMLPAWEQGLPSDWLRWSILHDFPVTSEKLILWVRNDMFIDSQNSQ